MHLATQTEPTVRRSSIKDNLVTVSNSRKLHVDPRMPFIKSLASLATLDSRLDSCGAVIFNDFHQLRTQLGFCQTFHWLMLCAFDFEVLGLRVTCNGVVADSKFQGIQNISLLGPRKSCPCCLCLCKYLATVLTYHLQFFRFRYNSPSSEEAGPFASVSNITS